MPPKRKRSHDVEPIFHAARSSAIITNGTTSSVKFTITGTPLALKRPKVGSGRYSASGPSATVVTPTKPKRYHTYSPSQKDQKVFSDAIVDAIGAQSIPDSLKNSNNLHVSVTFYFPRPMEHFNSSGDIKDQHTSIFIYCQKADIDNLVKFVLDCLQEKKIGIVRNDYTISRITADKRWSNRTVSSVDNKKVGVGAVCVSIDDELIQAPSCPYIEGAIL